MGDEVEVARAQVIGKLQQLQEVKDLQEICIGLSVNVPPSKYGKLLAVRNLLVRYLSSEEVENSTDGGLQMFQDVGA